ncbi:MAG: hypothetical protein QHH43_06370 [Candidatus Saccharicenans sp.]|nr:hypothetical protein [Candidatus Saccharicenans sp.]MDH7575364.1 hypothetical protein [Candidatus Saccharicenans sp.]NPV84114.1 hypothetical protein [Candidatus Aminicenantes bacterium]
MLKKIISIFLSISFCGLTMALAQEENLAELARKERERRESLKDKKVRVVTNKDLEKLTKTEALTLPPQTLETAGAEATFPPAGQQVSGSQQSTPATVHRVNVENPPQGSGGIFPGTAGAQDVSGGSLEEAWKKAKEYVELLTLKLNSLWAEFYGQTDMKSKDYVQMQISETYEKLTKAQEEEARLRQQYENQINRKKSESASPIWIK